MIWKKTPLSNVISTNVLYYDPEYKTVCEDICKTLHIDCFPDFKTTTYWKLDEGSWQNHEIKNTLENDANLGAFDPQILKMMIENDSNIIFTNRNNIINGVLHFTNYQSSQVSSHLYENLHLFETKLRAYLSHLGFDYSNFIEYHDYKTRGDDYHSKRIKELKSPKFQERALTMNPLEMLYLRELLDFSISSYHSNEMKQSIGFVNSDIRIDPAILGSLRNDIMHAKDITGQSLDKPFDFNTFQDFFNSVLRFHEVFQFLSDKIFEIEASNRRLMNKSKLSIFIDKSPTEIRNFFNLN